MLLLDDHQEQQQTTCCSSCEIIPFRVIESSSEDEQYPASNLERQYQEGGGEKRGWRSAAADESTNVDVSRTTTATNPQQQHYLIIQPLLMSSRSRTKHHQQEEHQQTWSRRNRPTNDKQEDKTPITTMMKVSTIQIILDENMSPVQSMEIFVSSIQEDKQEDDDDTNDNDDRHQHDEREDQEVEASTTAPEDEVAFKDTKRKKENHQQQQVTTHRTSISSDEDEEDGQQDEDVMCCQSDNETLFTNFKSLGRITFFSMHNNHDHGMNNSIVTPLSSSSAATGGEDKSKETQNHSTTSNNNSWLTMRRRKELISIYMGNDAVIDSFSYLKLVLHLYDGEIASSCINNPRNGHEGGQDNNGITPIHSGATTTTTMQQHNLFGVLTSQQQIGIITLMLLSNSTAIKPLVTRLSTNKQQLCTNAPPQVIFEGSSTTLPPPQMANTIDPNVPVRASRSSSEKQRNALDSSSNDDNYLVRKRIDALEKIKRDKAQNEDFEAAAKIKEAIGIVQKYVITVNESQEAMQAASKNEDYLKASRYKAKRDSARLALIETLDKIENSLTSDHGSQDTSTKNKFDACRTHHKFDDISLSTIPRVEEEDEPSVLTTATASGPLFKTIDKPILENIGEQSRYSSNNSCYSSSIHEQFMSPLFYSPDQDKHAPTHPLEGVPDFENLPTPEDINILEGRDEMGRSLSINNSHLTIDSMQKINAILGSYCTRCLFSKNWSLREAALLKLSLELQTRIIDNKTNYKSTADWWDGFSRGLIMILEKALNDRIVQVFLTGLLLLDDCIIQFEEQCSSQKEVLSLIGNLLIQLIDKLGDNNPKVVEGCETALMSVAFSNTIGPMYVGSQVMKLMSLSDPKSMKSVAKRCIFLQNLLEEFGNEAPSCEKFLEFIESFGLKHKDADAREAVKELAVALFLRDGQEVLTLMDGMPERVAKEYQVAFLHARQNMKPPISNQMQIKNTLLASTGDVDDAAATEAEIHAKMNDTYIVNTVPLDQAITATIRDIEHDITKKAIGRRGRGRGRRGTQHNSAFNL